MARTVVDLTLSTLRDLLVEEVKFLVGVAGEVREVQTQLRELQALTEDVDRKKYDDLSVANYVKEIRDLCYRIEDVVEGYATDVQLQKSGEAESIIEILSRIVSRLCWCVPAHEIGTEIISINKSISKLYESMVNYGFIKSTMEPKEKSDGVDGKKGGSRKTYGREVRKDFVGMKKDFTSLVAALMNGKDNVVSIYGMGGSGKTTLAEKIFLDKEIRPRFKTFAWVCVSQVCNRKSVFQDLLEKLCNKSRETTDKMGDSMLGDEVYGALQKQEYLVVLDDVWELKDWRCLSHAFPVAKATSKILITTRNKDVAKLGFSHPLGLLSRDEAWELLQKSAFPTTDPKDLRLDPILEKVGREIVRKCGYLPLAISVIGDNQLRNSVSLGVWETVSKNIDVYTHGREGDERVKQILSLSYDNLPFHLKPCFLYLSQFQEDETIRVEELGGTWIAESIVSAKNQGKEETLMDVAEGYLRELAARSMVLARENTDYIFFPEQKAKVTYRLHDLLRDLCVAKSGEEEFHQVVDFRGGKRPTLSLTSSSTSSSHPLRRLAVYIDEHVDSVSLTTGDDSTQKLRSLRLYGPSSGASPILSRRLIELKKLKFLRVLIFRFVSFMGEDQLLEGLGGLVHLRILSFWGCTLSVRLPSCIGDLPSLEVLEIDHIFGIVTIPNVLHKMKRLKRIRLQSQNAKVDKKLALSGLDELEEIDDFDCTIFEVTDLATLKGLRRLRGSIQGNGELSMFLDSIESCPDLGEVIVYSTACDFGSEEGMALLRKLFMSRNVHCMTQTTYRGGLYGGQLPDYEPGFFPNLTYLYLWIEGVLRDPMTTLEKLPMLRTLILEKSYDGEEMSCSAEAFPQLRSLRLNLPNLKAWKVEEGAMPRLSLVDLGRCYKLKMIPERIKSLTTKRGHAVAEPGFYFSPG